MVTKKIRTEYMKKFRDPRWETFSKCYEDSLKYRLTRRVMEHSHKPWFWEGWDSGSNSSGWSTPRVTRNRVAPLSGLPPPSSEVQQKLLGLRLSSGPRSSVQDGENEVVALEAALPDTAAPTENGVTEAGGGSDELPTDNEPVDSPSSDGEPVNLVPKRRDRRRTSRSEPGHQQSSIDDKPPLARKPQRAKSQPPCSTKEEKRWSSGRLDWTEVKKTPNDSHTSDACVQTHRSSTKRCSNPDRRRARSADPDKIRHSQLAVVDDRWMTEYMRCFSARLR
ncbi:centriole, cilia and spindle-associated protein [Aulostomus maculatus]